MTVKATLLTDRLMDYALATWSREDGVKRRLRDETAKLKAARMQIAPDQGQAMAVLARLIGARRALEIGTFTGYSALCVAEALGPGGRLVACDVSEEWTAIGKPHWRDAGVADRIDLRIGPAIDTLDGLVAAGGAGTFDMAFIDADKDNYDRYYERCLVLVRAGGLILVDNVLWSGAVIDPSRDDADTRAIRALNLKLRDDPRIDLALLPLGDGVTMARKR